MTVFNGDDPACPTEDREHRASKELLDIAMRRAHTIRLFGAATDEQRWLAALHEEIARLRAAVEPTVTPPCPNCGNSYKAQRPAEPPSVSQAAYESAVQGRSDFRDAYRQARELLGKFVAAWEDGGENMDRLCEMARNFSPSVTKTVVPDGPVTSSSYTIAGPYAGIPADETDARLAIEELKNIINARRWNRDCFDDDTAFADWAQSRARYTLGLIQRP